MADETFGVIDSSKTYTHHAIARILGVADSRGECSKYILRNMLHDGLPFRKIGRLYFIAGLQFNLWIQETSAVWSAWKEPATKSSADEEEIDSSCDGTTTSAKSGARKRSTRRVAAMQSS